MPSTFTHPLAVLPLRRWCPVRLNFAALVIGSMSPDFGYFIRQFPLARYAHTIAGTFAVCLPTGLLALGVFYLLRQPLCFILPQPHRGALTPLASARPSFHPRTLLKAAVSILLGAWTHTVWDSFTHQGAWSVERIPALGEALFRIGGTVFPASYLLQQFSTFVGGAVLALLYFRWLRRQPRDAAAAPDSFSDRLRYGLLAALTLIALAVALPAATDMASRFHGYLGFRVLIFRTAVYAAGTFVPLLALTAVILFALHRRRTASQR